MNQAKSNPSHIVYAPRRDAAPEAELLALSACYRFILNCYAKEKAAHPGGLDDVREDLVDAHTAKKKCTG